MQDITDKWWTSSPVRQQITVLRWISKDLLHEPELRPAQQHMHADTCTNNYYKYHTSPRTRSSQLHSAADDEVIMLATQLNDLSRSWLINKYLWEAGEQHWGIYNPHSWVQNTHEEFVQDWYARWTNLARRPLHSGLDTTLFVRGSTR